MLVKRLNPAEPSRFRLKLNTSQETRSLADFRPRGRAGGRRFGNLEVGANAQALQFFTLAFRKRGILRCPRTSQFVHSCMMQSPCSYIFVRFARAEFGSSPAERWLIEDMATRIVEGSIQNWGFSKPMLFSRSLDYGKIHTPWPTAHFFLSVSGF